MILSSVLMTLGYLFYSLNPQPIDTAKFTTFKIVKEILMLSPEGILFIGIAILLLSPIGGVLMLMGYFLSIRDQKFSLIAILVLIFMITGLLLQVK